MKIEVLVATTNQNDFSLVEKMNIKTDAFVANQCDRYEYNEINVNGKRIRYFSTAEKGVGLNRNNALMRANGDIVVFADDDMKFVDEYEALIKKEKSRFILMHFNRF